MKFKSFQNILLIIATLSSVNAQDLNLKNRNYFCISAGIGVNYANFPDVVDYITSVSGKRTSEFDGALELWTIAEFKIKNDVALKLDYSYITKGYNVEVTSIGAPLNYNFTYQVHSPTINLNFLFFQQDEIYIAKLGIGFGFIKGYFNQSLPIAAQKITYKANGGLIKFETIFSSRLDGRVYVHLSMDARLGLSTEAVDEYGNKLIIRKPFGEDRNLRLNFIGVAIRAGFSYYF